MTTHRRSLVELVTALRRRSSLSPRQIRIRSRSIMWLFCVCKHVVSAVYFIVSGYIYTILSNTERITLNAYQPKLCGSMYFLLAALHVYGVGLDMVPTGRRRRRGSLLHSLTMHTRTPHYWLCGFQCAEIGVQSVQAWWLSYLTTNKSLLTTYVSCIILHCLVSPWFILSTIPFFHTTFRLFVNSIIGFALTVLFPLVTLLPVLIAKESGGILAQDARWRTTTTLLVRTVVPTSGWDATFKFIMCLANYSTLRTLAGMVRKIPPQGVLLAAPRIAPRPVPDTPPPPGPQLCDLGVQPSARVFLSTRDAVRVLWDQYWDFRMSRICTAMCLVMSLWGLVLVVHVWLVVAPLTSCPDACLEAITPFFTSSGGCHCVYYHLRCTDNETTSHLEDQLTPTLLGHDLHYLGLSHCAHLVDGLNASLLLPFYNLAGFGIAFSPLTSFNVSASRLPKSLLYLELRYTALRSIPELATTLHESNVISLALDGNSISFLPDVVSSAWRNLLWLSVAEANLSYIPLSVATLPQLEYLDVHGNRITDVPVQLLGARQLLSVSLATNRIRHVPSLLLQSPPPWVLDVSCNPLVSPLSPAPWVLVAPCLNGCASKLIGNGVCNRPCNTSHARWDGGDCASL